MISTKWSSKHVTLSHLLGYGGYVFVEIKIFHYLCVCVLEYPSSFDFETDTVRLLGKFGPCCLPFIKLHFQNQSDSSTWKRRKMCFWLTKTIVHKKGIIF